VDKTGTFNTFQNLVLMNQNFGGIFTQQDIRDIVQYAKDRFVNVLPEIDVPGHSMAALASYPELTCTPGTYVVNSGEKFMEWPAGGHFYDWWIILFVRPTRKPMNSSIKFLQKWLNFSLLNIYIWVANETARNFWEKVMQLKH
jgi:hexosaminidase